MPVTTCMFISKMARICPFINYNFVLCDFDCRMSKKAWKFTERSQQTTVLNQ